MLTFEDLRQRSDSLFRVPTNRKPVTLAADLPPEAVAVGRSFRRFLVFDEAHQETALRLVDRWMETVDQGQGSDEALSRALDQAAAAMEEQNSDLVKYALGVFITHHPAARPLRVPSIQEIKPLSLLPSHPGVPPNDVVALGGLGIEARMDYFREANQYNEHHEKWHRVFPSAGAAVPGNPFVRRYKERQGELFWYMHQQMLARYDTDRLARELPPVVALSDYRERIGEGYDIEPGQEELGFTSRDPDLLMQDLPGYPVALHERVRDLIRQATADGFFRVNGFQVPLTRDLLGAVLEANLGARATVDGQRVDLRQFYGSLHNSGHGMLANLSPGGNGVMTDTSTAVRDPIFYRWHRHVDDLFAGWQETLLPHDLAAGAPPVRLRKDAAGESADIGLARLAQLPGALASGADFGGAAFGQERFGGANWDRPLAEFTGPDGPLTDTLVTRIGTEAIALPNGNEFEKFILDHDEFAYFFRLENTSDAERRVTVRVFLAAADRAADRRWWIEMDKFLHILAAGERAVVYRPARFSSVVRKPALRPSEGTPPGDDDLCDCGWPYHMLLPRGTAEGMPFRLCVLLTDAEQDLQDSERRCGSVSFCGSRDSTYPDRQEMGFPFNRPFKDRSIADTVAAADLPHLAGKALLIQHAG
jgi:hemocyanin-like protein